MIVYIYLFVFGLVIGSFLNVLIDRLPNEKSIMGRSQCDYCHHKLNGSDLFPIISFIVLRAKCRYCGKKISYQYPLIEFLTGTTFVLVWVLTTGNILIKSLHLGLASTLLVIFFADIKYQIIPDSMQVAFFVFSLFIHVFSLKFFWNLEFGIWNFFKSGVVVMLPILILYWLTKGRGMGFGDVKLAFVIGFFLGFKSGLLTLYAAFILGASIGLLLIVFRQKKLKSKIAFGPFLILSMIIVITWQKPIYELVYKIYGL